MLDFGSIVDHKLVLSKFEQQGIDCLHIDFDDVNHLQKVVPDLVRSNVAIVPGAPRMLPVGFRRSHMAFMEVRGLNRIRQYNSEDQVISVDAGMTYQELDAVLAEKQQWFPVRVADPQMTLAAIVDRGKGGCIEHGFGGPRDLVLGLELALATGELIKCGGKVVKNVTGYNLQKLFIGSHSSLAIVTAVDLRLFVRPETQLSLIWHGQFNDLLDAQRLLTQTGIRLSCMELISVETMKLIPDKLATLAAHDGGYLLIQIHGSDHQTKQINSQLKLLLNKLEFVGSTEDQNIWTSLADLPCDLGQYSLEILTDTSMLRLIYEKLLHKQTLAWQARTSKGWIKILVESLEQLESLIEKAGILAKENSKQIILAYPDSKYEYKVQRLPVEGIEANKLKDAIKLRYDPNSCLNPLVCL